MYNFKLEELPDDLQRLILGEDPEDISIIDSKGSQVAVIIPKYLYEFLEQKMEESEEEWAQQAIEKFHKSDEYKEFKYRLNTKMCA